MKLRTIFQAVLLAAASLGSAHAAEAGATVTFSNLSFQLMDLNPTDGVQAAYQLGGLRMIADYAAPFELADGNVYGNYIGPDPSEGGLQGLSPQGFDLSGSQGRILGRWDGATLTTQVLASTPGAYANATAQLDGVPQSPYGGMEVTLAAHSLLIVSVDAAATIAMTDVPGCQVGFNPLSNQGCASALQFVDASGTLALDYALSSDDTGGYASFYDTVHSHGFVDTTAYDADGYYTGEVQGFSMEQTGNLARRLQVVFANTSSQSQIGYLHLMANVSATGPQAYVMPETPITPEVPTVPTVPEVPEPGTWSLMALGGLGLAAAVRRRRAVSNQT